MFLALLLACAPDAKPPVGDTADVGPACPSWWPDADGDGHGDWALGSVEDCGTPDGYVRNRTDCDDTRADVSPDGFESCDGVDEDCDTVADDGFEVYAWWPDEDGDGYGDDAAAAGACSAPEGYIDRGGDCDDGDATVSPLGVEVCDGVDQDCDGAVDDGVQGDIFADADGDGYGDAVTRWSGCPEPGWISDGTDCDDTTADVNPGVVEVCGNGRDDDCDGGTNGCGLVGTSTPVGEADAVLLGGAAADYAGIAVASAGDGDLDGFDDLLVGAHGWGDAVGAAYLVRGPASGTAYLEDAPLVLRGELSSDALGLAVAGVGDATGDGVPDFVVGAPGQGGGTTPGAAYLVSGDRAGEHVAADVATTTFVGELLDDYAGRAVVGLGDIDGDGLADLLVGAPRLLATPGAAYVVHGGVSGLVDLGASPRLLGAEAQTGIQLSAADLDGDGIRDAIVRGQSRVFVALLPLDADLDLSAADVVVEGERQLTAVAGVPDVDGDGRDDLVVGEAQAGSSQEGVVRLYGGALAGTLAAGDATGSLSGLAVGDNLGAGLAPPGDLDGDGRDEIAATATYGGADDVGALYVLRGSTLEVLAVREVLDLEYAGLAVAAAGDIDGDGVADLLAGSYTDRASDYSAGAAYLFLGGEGW